MNSTEGFVLDCTRNSDGEWTATVACGSRWPDRAFVQIAAPPAAVQDGGEMTTLQDLVRHKWFWDCKKNGLDRDDKSCEAYADEWINELTPAQLVEVISDALRDLNDYNK